jgi:glycolate oxidase iron-sulfur subunit
MASQAPESSKLSRILSKEQEKILACVHCGLCLEACPTYVVTGDENDGPRGRIYLMRAVEEGKLPSTSRAFETHIDRCLGCRACEAACPAGVEYGQLLEVARAELAAVKASPGPAYALLQFLLRQVWLYPGRLRAAFRVARLVRDSGIASFLIKTKIARGISPRFEFGLLLLQGSQATGVSRTFTRKDREDSADAKNKVRDKVLLFAGCVTDGLFHRVNEATVRVLEANDYEVIEPPAQVCCGALHAHAGDLEGARKLARENIAAFTNPDVPIITNAGGCGAMLVSYQHLLANDSAYAGQARDFSARVRDIGQQLTAKGFRNGAAIGDERTTYDASCHLLHGQHAASDSLQMLWAIPGLNFALLKDSEVCCGGAGVYNLLEPELSGAVLDEKLKQVEATDAEVLATGNPGCHMQIAAGARLAEMKLRVAHPVELLDESYRRARFYD